METPVISDKPVLTLAEAKVEYRQLLEILNAKVFPNNGTGWATSVLNRIEDRLNYLRTVIVNYVLETKDNE